MDTGKINCCQKIMKHTFIITIVPFLLLSLIVMIFGLYELSTISNISEAIKDGSISRSYIILAVLGFFLTVLFFLGCCGLKKESYCMVMTFAILTGLALAVEVIAGGSAFAMRSETDSLVLKGLNLTFANIGNSTEDREAWDSIQSTLECCGINGTADYETFFHNSSLPLSCCSGNVTNCTTTSPSVYKNGCSPIAIEKLNASLATIGKVAIAIGCLHLIWVVGACYFASVFRKHNRYETV